jgi:hypothetical protein
MGKEILVKILNDALLPFGFKRKGNTWVLNGPEINKIVNMQRSLYSNLYYINYGYVINSLPKDGFFMHVDKRLGSYDKQVDIEIRNLLDFENSSPENLRIEKLSNYVNSIIVEEMNGIKNELDLLHHILRGPLYGIPTVVLKHFNLSAPG